MKRQTKQTVFAVIATLLIGGVVLAQSAPLSSGSSSSADLSTAVLLTGNQTIAGDKTFSGTTTGAAIKGTRFDNVAAASAGLRFSGSDTYVMATSNTADVHIGNDTGAHATIKGTGGLIWTVNPGAKPTCDSTNRGINWRTEGGAGVADTQEWCCKTAADAYAWKTTPGCT